ncbi:putative bifunctional diguanylate cyclase/phosphodiesterase [Cognatilysobacter bugurensis]|nr:EAL domain-containing protein [Lysobacter bugurensis]
MLSDRALQSLRPIADSVTDFGFVVLDDDRRIRLWNRGAERLFRFNAAAAEGERIDLIFTPADCADCVPEREIRAAHDDGIAVDKRWHIRRDGSRVWIDGSVSPVRSADGVDGYVKIMRDATADKRRAEALARLARVDALTGLANRLAFNEQLELLAESTLRRGQQLIIHVLDLDRFKEVNDRLGHAAGDDLLRQAARRMERLVRKADVLARLGGDEFGLIQTDVHELDGGRRVAQQLVDALGAPFTVEGEEVSVSASIGLAVFPHDTSELPQLLRMADGAMYRVKSETRSGYRFASRELDREAHRLGEDRAALREAVQRKRFELHYQPQVGANGGGIVGAEALLRCTDKRLAHRTPDEIITMARGCGLMHEITLWALSEACGQVRLWHDAGLPHFRIALNLCVNELLDPAIFDHVQDALARSGLCAGDLEVELTERELLDHDRCGGTALQRLRDAGMRVAIDDFGTGYSALSYLARLPVDRIKIDRLFVQHMPGDPQSCAIAQAIIALAHTLPLDVVAEGVETLEQVRYFEDVGCEALQGYWFARPMPGPALAHWIAHAPAAGRA